MGIKIMVPAPCQQNDFRQLGGFKSGGHVYRCQLGNYRLCANFPWKANLLGEGEGFFILDDNSTNAATKEGAWEMYFWELWLLESLLVAVL